MSAQVVTKMLLYHLLRNLKRKMWKYQAKKIPRVNNLVSTSDWLQQVGGKTPVNGSLIS